MLALPPSAVSLLSRYQGPLALLCVVALALDVMGVLPLPRSAELAIAIAAGVLGVQRPSEAALKLAAEAGPYPGGGIKVGALLAAIAGAAAMLPSEVEAPGGRELDGAAIPTIPEGRAEESSSGTSTSSDGSTSESIDSSAPDLGGGSSSDG